MAYAASGLVLLAHGADKKFWRYDSTADALATIETAGYFINTTNINRMSVGDTILVFASNAQKWLRVTVVHATTGSITTVGAFGESGALLVSSSLGNTPSTLTELQASGVIAILTTSTAAATWTVAAPYLGADLKVFNLSSAPITLHLSTAAGTTPTWDGTNDDLVSTLALQSFNAVGLSATRFGVVSNSTEAGATSVMTFA